MTDPAPTYGPSGRDLKEERKADAFVASKHHDLAKPEPETRLPMWRPTALDAEGMDRLGRDPTEFEVTLRRGRGRAERDRTPSEVVLPRRTQRRLASKALLLDEHRTAVRSYDEARRAELARSAAPRLAEPVAPRLSPAEMDRRLNEAQARRDQARDRRGRGGFCYREERTGLPGSEHRRDVAEKAWWLAGENARSLSAEWLADHQHEVYRAADRGEPWYTVLTPFENYGEAEAATWAGVAEWQVARERRPDDPTGYLLGQCLPRARALARAEGRDPRSADRDERRRIRVLSGQTADDAADVGREARRRQPPKCKNPNGCDETAERNGRRWRSRCPACRDYKRNHDAERPLELVNRARDRKRGR